MDPVARIGSQALTALDSLPSRSSRLTPSAAPSDFSGELTRALASVNELQQDAAHQALALQAGDGTVSLEDSMIAIQKASIAFQGVVQVRNRLVSAYHDVMNMQI